MIVQANRRVQWDRVFAWMVIIGVGIGSWVAIARIVISIWRWL